MQLYFLVVALLGLACNQSQTATMELLQGTWQHVEDPTNYLVFDKNLRKEIAGGMSEWDAEAFILSDKCLNETDKGAVANNESNMLPI